MGPLVRILSSARQLWPWYVGILVCGIAISATGLLTPFIIKAATDYVVSVVQGEASGIGPVMWLALALLVTDLTNTALSNVGGYLGDVMAVRLRAILSSRYFSKLLSLPQRYFDNELTGTIINRLQRSITETTNFLNSFANGFFPTVLTSLAVLVITSVYSWPIALLLLAIYPVFMWLTARTSRRWQVLEREKNEQYDIAGGRFAEVVGQIRVVKSFGRERGELSQFESRYDNTVALTRHQSRYWHAMDVSRRGALNVIFFAIFAIVFVQTVRGEFTIGDMVLLIQLVNLARQPVFSMSYWVDSWQRAVAGCRSYAEVMAEPGEPDVAALSADSSACRTPTSTATTQSEVAAEGRGVVESADDGGGAPGGEGGVGVRFEQVSFGYAADDEVLREISFDIPAGGKVALVGESGGGKTTIASLLLGLYRPDSGTIRLGGADIGGLPLTELRAAIGVVFQDPSLFSGTIRENIAYGDPGAGDDAIEAAARAAGAHSFIVRFRDGYDSEIGERGLKLSGGQKQRIAVARAILKDAPVLVLDEATSSLDTKSERAVQEGLEHLMAGRTTLIIAHRLSTIASVDRIVTLRDGRVDEIGSPAELAASGGIYAELLALQQTGTKRSRKRLTSFDIRA